MGIDDIGKMSTRLKGEQSLYDKIANYMLEHKGTTLEDSIKDVRDATFRYNIKVFYLF